MIYRETKLNLRSQKPRRGLLLDICKKATLEFIWLNWHIDLSMLRERMRESIVVSKMAVKRGGKPCERIDTLLKSVVIDFEEHTHNEINSQVLDTGKYHSQYKGITRHLAILRFIFLMGGNVFHKGPAAQSSFLPFSGHLKGETVYYKELKYEFLFWMSANVSWISYSH